MKIEFNVLFFTQWRFTFTFYFGKKCIKKQIQHIIYEGNAISKYKRLRCFADRPNLHYVHIQHNLHFFIIQINLKNMMNWGPHSSHFYIPACTRVFMLRYGTMYTFFMVQCGTGQWNRHSICLRWKVIIEQEPYLILNSFTTYVLKILKILSRQEENCAGLLKGQGTSPMEAKIMNEQIL